MLNLNLQLFAHKKVSVPQRTAVIQKRRDSEQRELTVSL